MPSASFPARDALEGYLAGRVPAEQLVIAVAAAYYGEAARGERERLRPLVEVIDRAAPGVVELAGIAERPGFAIRVVERPFPPAYEAELRRAVAACLAGEPRARPLAAPAAVPAAPARGAGVVPGVLGRVLGVLRRLWRRAAAGPK
jgi:hypothetical protein